MAQGLATVLLLAAALAPWVAAPLAVVLLAAAAAMAALAGLLGLPGAAALTAFALLARRYAQRPEGSAGWLVWAALLLACALLYLHLVPGFGAWRAMGPVAIGAGAPYEKWLSLDKTGAGLLLVALALPERIGRGGWTDLLRRAWPFWIATPAGIAGLGLAAGVLHWDVTLVRAFLWWGALNLLTTCLAEEALFRGLLQARLVALAEARRVSPHLAIAASALIFGLVHLPGGAGLVALACLAGLGYGYAFQRTGRIEAAVLGHFALNAAHFLLFTYPFPAA